MIKQETINEIINACRIEEVVGDFVRLHKRGVNYIGLCPFHNEKTPSFTVSPTRGICKCFGCGVAGDSIGFIMKHEHYSYVEALRYLAKKYNIEIQETEQTAENIQKLGERDALLSLTAFASEYFSHLLFHSDEGKSIGLSYFKERGFIEDTIQKFQLGYALKQRDNFLNHALKKGFTLENLEKSGLIIATQKENGIARFDRFSERIIFPIHNFSGKVIGFGGRILSNVNKKSAKYINSPESPIYHKSDVLYGIFQAKNAIRKADKCYLVEGYTDVLSLYQAGIENVIASSGTSLTEGQIKQINKLTNNITVLYDGDSAGIEAAIRAVGMLLKEDLNIRIIILPETEDPDSFARKNDLQQIRQYFSEQEKDFIQFKIDILLKDKSNDPIKKAEFVNQIAADIASIPDIIKVTLFVKQCSDLLDIPETVLLRRVNKIRLETYKENKIEPKKNIGETQVVQPLPIQIDQKELSALQIEEVEKKLLFLLVNYGEKTINTQNKDEKDEPIFMRVDQFIFNNLDNDGLQFETFTYQKFLDIYAEIAEKDTVEIKDAFYLYPDEDIKNLYINLVDIKPTPSPLWESDKVRSFITTIDNSKNKLYEEIIRTLQMLRLVTLRNMKTKKNQQLKTCKNEQETKALLSSITEITKIITQIEKQLGVDYR